MICFLASTTVLLYLLPFKALKHSIPCIALYTTHISLQTQNPKTTKVTLVTKATRLFKKETLAQFTKANCKEKLYHHTIVD